MLNILAVMKEGDSLPRTLKALFLILFCAFFWVIASGILSYTLYTEGERNMLINGTVKNYIGVPLGDKRVKLHYETYVDHYDRPSFNIETSTNSEGHFQFELTERVLAFSVTVYHYQERLSYSKGKVSNKQYALDFTIDEQRENIRVSEKSDNVSVYVARELSPEALESQRTGQPVPIRKADSTSIHIIKPIPYRIDEWLID